ncbi:endo-beta-1,3-glucanase [Diplocarpon rosae]|nr:endo-beta-1,3-glucanase [Diplocarpon rosae]
MQRLSPVDHNNTTKTTTKTSTILHPTISPGTLLLRTRTFTRLRAARRYSREPSDYPLLDGYAHSAAPEPAPAPPPHRDAEGRIWGQELGYTDSQLNITPGADNFDETAADGIAGVAMGVADANARGGGLEPMRNPPGYDPRMETRGGSGSSSGHDGSEFYEYSPYSHPGPRQELSPSQSSLTPLGAAAFPPGLASPQARSVVSRSPHSSHREPYVDNPNPYQQRFSRNIDPFMGEIDPSSIDDDGDDGLNYGRQNRSNISLSHDSHGQRAVPAGAATGGVLGALGGLVGKKAAGSSSGMQYDPVATSNGGPNNFDLGQGPEKSAWAAKTESQKKGRRCWMMALIIFVIFGAIVGGIAGGIVGSQRSGSGGSKKEDAASASSDTANNGDLNKDSTEIKELLGNPKLHKVFPGIDYTPMYTQYPDCLSYPPSQNNVTRDLAVISQLTNTIRLYGTDCNQTELVIHSIGQLGLNNTMKIWMGVWQDKNQTTNARQLVQMYDIFDKYGADPFIGVIVGNEVLYREDMTLTELGDVLSGVKSNLTARGIDLPLSTSDLGDDWTQGLADIVDIVMANIHPFFAGVTADTAAGWTWNFWQTNNPWKIKFNEEGKEWEDKWGLMDVNRNLKSGVEIPDCGGKTVS